MELHQKLQELRKQKGLTQEQVATALYVSRTAVSKWESGRGYPSIESLKLIAKFFSLTIDELLSSDEILTIAEEDGKQKERRIRDLTFGLLDVLVIMLLFLPFFAVRIDGVLSSASLVGLNLVKPYIVIPYYILVIGATVFGILTLVLQNCQNGFWIKNKAIISLTISVASVLFFIITLQPYPAVFVLILLIIKALTLIKT